MASFVRWEGMRGGVGVPWRWLCLWGWVVIIALAGGGRAVAGQGCGDYHIQPGSYHQWTYSCDSCTSSKYGKYVLVEGDVVQSAGIDPGTCWGGGVTSWQVVINFHNQTTLGDASGDPAQPSYLKLTEYRIKLINSTGTTVHTETIPPSQMNSWFNHPDSNYGTSMSWLEPDQNGAG